MGHGHSKTAFVGIDHRPAAQSYMPCHLFGNSEIYGLGIRLSFYIQYFTAIVALAIGLRPSKLWSVRIGLAIVAISIFIALCINATGNTLVILDWYIGIALVAAYIFAADYVHAPYFGRAWIRSRKTWSDRKARSKIRAIVRKGGPAVAGDDGLHASRFLDAARVVYRDLLARRPIYHAAEHYNEEAQPASAEVRDHAAQLVQDAAADDYVLLVHPFNQDVVQGLVDFHFEHAAAVEAQHAVYRIAEREAAILLDEEHLRDRRGATSLGYDRLIGGIICLSWAAYQCVKPWLYFVAVNRGARPQFGCDVKVFWFFVPISIYREGFITFLKITSIVSVIIAAAVALWGLYLLATSLFNLRAWSAEPSYSRVESQNASHRRTAAPGDHLSDTSSEHSDHDDEPKKLKPKKREKRERKLHRWMALLQAIVFVITVGVVEGTIAINHLDMSASALGSTAELIAFLVALVTSVPLLWECLVIVPLRLLTGRSAEPDFEIVEKPQPSHPHHPRHEPTDYQAAPAGNPRHEPAVMTPAGTAP
jgi:ABC-type nickel/cobalt efflux system permease component RcnA